MTQEKISRYKTIAIYILTILIGYILFIAPNIFFGVTKLNGGFTGINLLFTALFQFFTICTLLYFSLTWISKDFSYIGLTFENWKKDILLGMIVGISWLLLQFSLIIPLTGGAERADISGMVSTFDGSLSGIASYIALGVIGGGITEELFNRGYFINVLKSVFKNPKTGLWISSILSIIIFSLGHLPTSSLDWFDILVPTIAYTLLFIYTGRLTSSIIAHSIYNLTAILATYFLYYV